MVESYKSEILPHWRFKTPAEAKSSSKTIRAMFEAYKTKGDLLGMDMARKFLQMGFTRARRYANHASGRKHGDASSQDEDWSSNEKAESARIFKTEWDAVRVDQVYLTLKKQLKKLKEGI